MATRAVQIGDKVEGGKAGTDDHDIGRIVDISDSEVEIAWSAGVRTTIPTEHLYSLRDIGSSEILWGC